MKCTNPFKLKDQNVVVPCGRCIGCRVAKSREWYTRIWHECVQYESNLFVTLTYDDEHLMAEVDKGELQRYLKRLRRYIEPHRIKYYGVGEYGEVSGRSHYHIIIMNMNTDGHKLHKKNGGLQYVLKGPLYDAWKKGHVSVGTVTKDSIRYVTDYIHKKLYNTDKEECREKYGERALKEQPFNLMSQGLGLEYCMKNAEYFKEKKGCTVFGVEVGLPRYYREKLEIEDTPRFYRDEEDRNARLLEKFGLPMEQGMYKRLWQRREQIGKYLEAKERKFSKGGI